MNKSGNTASDPLIDAMIAAEPESPENWEHLHQKMGSLALTYAEYHYFIDAIESASNKKLIVSLLASGIWDNDRAAMHVMTRSFPSTVQIVQHAADTETRNPTNTVRKILADNVHQSWTYASRANEITDEEYDEMSAYVNALYLAKSIYIYQSVRTNLRQMKDIIFPLMENQDLIVPATAAIVDVWEGMRSNRGGGNRQMTIENVFGIARAAQETPEVLPRLVQFAADRGYFDLDAAMDYATLPGHAVAEGVL